MQISSILYSCKNKNQSYGKIKAKTSPYLRTIYLSISCNLRRILASIRHTFLAYLFIKCVPLITRGIRQFLFAYRALLFQVNIRRAAFYSPFVRTKYAKDDRRGLVIFDPFFGEADCHRPIMCTPVKLLGSWTKYLSNDSVGDHSKGTECSGVEFSNRDLGAYRQQSASTEYGILARYKYVFHRWQDGDPNTVKANR